MDKPVLLWRQDDGLLSSRRPDYFQEVTATIGDVAFERLAKDRVIIVLEWNDEDQVLLVREYIPEAGEAFQVHPCRQRR